LKFLSCGYSDAILRNHRRANGRAGADDFDQIADRAFQGQAGVNSKLADIRANNRPAFQFRTRRHDLKTRTAPQSGDAVRNLNRWFRVSGALAG